jgi:hypothetical protein
MAKGEAALLDRNEARLPLSGSILRNYFCNATRRPTRTDAMILASA